MKPTAQPKGPRRPFPGNEESEFLPAEESAPVHSGFRSFLGGRITKAHNPGTCIRPSLHHRESARRKHRSALPSLVGWIAKGLRSPGGGPEGNFLVGVTWEYGPVGATGRSPLHSLQLQPRMGIERLPQQDLRGLDVLNFLGAQGLQVWLLAIHHAVDQIDDLRHPALGDGQ